MHVYWITVYIVKDDTQVQIRIEAEDIPAALEKAANQVKELRQYGR